MDDHLFVFIFAVFAQNKQKRSRGFQNVRDVNQGTNLYSNNAFFDCESMKQFNQELNDIVFVSKFNFEFHDASEQL